MSLARNTLVQSGLTFGSRILGFLRDAVLAAILGAGPLSDAFLAALRFPNLFRRVLAEGAFSQAFAPMYARTLAKEADGHGESDRIASEALSGVFAVAAIVVIACQVAMPWLYLGLFVGYVGDPVFGFAVLLAQIMMPYLAFMSMSAVFGGVLNAKGRFALFAAAPMLLNVTMLLAVAPFLLLGDPTDAENQRNAALAASVAVTVAGALQAGVLWWGVRRAGVRIKLGLPRWTADMKTLVALAFPGAIAGLAVQINIFISQILASLEEGAISYLNYADRLYQLPLGMIGVAVGLALLPRLATAAAKGDAADEQRAVDEGVALSMAFTLPAAAAFVVAPYFLMLGFWVRGAFTEADARMAADALFHFGWGVPAFVLIKVFAPAFFARQDTRRPMRYALVNMAANVVLGAGLFFALQGWGMPGFVGLAAATSAAAWINVALLAGTLMREGRWRLTPAFLGRMGRILAATGLMAFVVALAATQRETIIAVLGSKEVGIVVTAACGAGLYAVFALLFGAVRLSEVRGALRREKPPEGVRLSGGDE